MTRNRHIYLYAKNWYKETDVIEDLRTILLPIYSHRVDKDTIVHKLLKIVKPYMDNNEEWCNLQTFVEDVNPENVWKVGYRVEKADYDYETAVIHVCLSMLSRQNVSTILKYDGELGEADSDILPLTRERRY